MFTAVPRWDGEEGPRPRITIAPGVIALSRPDLARRERAAERAVHRRRLDADLAAARLREQLESDEDTDDGDEEQHTGTITEWSRRSRARMIRSLAEVDWSPMLAATAVPAMVTLTYPGDWEPVVASGRTLKQHLVKLWRQYERAWGNAWQGVWKLEFQRRGAPHVHMYMVPPGGRSGDSIRAAYDQARREWTPGRPRPRLRKVAHDGLQFREWLSVTWADIVAHPDPEEYRKHLAAGTGVDYAEGMRGSDPKRLAVYFTKHGTFAAKEYQHRVPLLWQQPGQGPGRFWGYRGLERKRVSVEIGWSEYYLVSRTMRRLSQRTRVWNPTTGQHEWRKAVRICHVERGRRIDWETGEVTYRQRRRVRRPVRRMQSSSGFVTVNDGASTAAVLSRLRETCL